MVLQRLDPAIEDFLITPAHVMLNDFSIDLNQWVSHRFLLPPCSNSYTFDLIRSYMVSW